MQGSKMKEVIVQDFSTGRLSQIITAKEAAWQGGKNQWLFKNGIIYLVAESGEYKHLIKFKEQYISIKYTPADFYIGDRSPEDMNLPELKEFISLKEKMGVDVTDFRIQYNMKLSIPFASLVFALLGAPLGLSPRRASGSIGLGLSIIVIFFYYIVTFISMAVGELKILSPEISAWIPNLITAGVGLYILKRASEK
jgi:lipopolysaccharide export system permease protein